MEWETYAAKYSTFNLNLRIKFKLKKAIKWKGKIVIGNSLKLSPSFPPLHTVRAIFTAYCVPSRKKISILSTTYTLRYSFIVRQWLAA